MQVKAVPRRVRQSCWLIHKSEGPVMNDKSNAVREAVAVFPNERSLQGAIDELLSSGFDQAELSLLASEAAVEQKLGHRYTKVSELEDDPNVPSAAYVSPEAIGDAEGAVIGVLIYVGAGVLMGPVAVAGGGIAAIAAAAVAGGTIGGGIGAFLANLIGRRHADYINEQLKHGGLLLWVRVWDEAREKKAVEILKRHSGEDVHVHEIAAA
jgi:hypothetical protein